MGVRVPPSALDETGKVDEDQFAEGDFIGEIEEFDAGTTSTGTFELDAGTSVLFHFNEGMVTTITVS